MKTHAIWATALVLAIAAISFSASQYQIEQAKQDGFMMRACVEAGGSWLHQWNNIPYCERPK